MRFMFIRQIIGWIVSFCLAIGNIVSIDWVQTEKKRSMDGSWHEWVIVWKNKADPSIFKQAHLLHVSTNLDDAEIYLVAIKKGVSVEQWVRKWSQHPSVDQLQPNVKIKSGERVFPIGSYVLDPYYHLRMIRAEQAWRIFEQKTKGKQPNEIIVAVVDTGVDYNHPKLSPFLMDGVNVKDRSKPAQDYMGHGTEVAGVIAGVWGAFRKGEKSVGRGKILPIKVMENGEDGEVYYTAEGIREAIRQKANIIVLAQGSWRFSPILKDVIQEAEEHGILVVGAVGNATLNADSEIIYNRPLYYPAAFPTVLAVGSVRMDGSHEPTSNIGDGIDLVAPGESITTVSLNQHMSWDSGTSFAAPQVAGVAALVWQLHPQYSPRQIRQLLIQSASKDPKQPRWDEKYGFGLLDAAEAVRTTWKPDISEPNNDQAHAMPLSFNQEMDAQIETKGDRDWYVVRPRHPGKIRLKWLDIHAKKNDLSCTVWIPSTNKRMVFQPSSNGEWGIDVPAQDVFLEVKANASIQFPIHYRFLIQFELNPDEYESNDRFVEAKVLSLQEGSNRFQATLHQAHDEDWYRIFVPSTGEVIITIHPRSPRLDPVMMFFPGENGRLDRIDQGGEGEPESFRLPVESGFSPLVFRIKDYGGNLGEEPYDLEIDFISRQEHDKVAPKTWGPGEVIDEQIEDDWDVDWYTIDWHGEGEWSWSLASKHIDTQWEWVLYDQQHQAVDRWSGALESNKPFVWKIPLKKGRYFLRLQGKTVGNPSHYRIEFINKN